MITELSESDSEEAISVREKRSGNGMKTGPNI